MSSHALVDWDDETSTVVKLTCIESPRKPFCNYEAGDNILSKCPGFPGKFKGTIVCTGEKKELDEKLKAYANTSQISNSSELKLVKKRKMTEKNRDEDNQPTQKKTPRKSSSNGKPQNTTQELTEQATSEAAKHILLMRRETTNDNQNLHQDTSGWHFDSGSDYYTDHNKEQSQESFTQLLADSFSTVYGQPPVDAYPVQSPSLQQMQDTINQLLQRVSYLENKSAQDSIHQYSILFNGKTREEYEQLLQKFPTNVTQGIKVLMGSLFTEHELRSCSLTGQGSLKRGLPIEKFQLMEELLHRNFNVEHRALRNKMRDRLKIFRNMLREEEDTCTN